MVLIVADSKDLGMYFNVFSLWALETFKLNSHGRVGEALPVKWIFLKNDQKGLQVGY